MKNLLKLMIALLPALSFANDYNVSCLSAGGYYGNIQASTMDNGDIQVIAAQGFSYKIGYELELGDVSELVITFPAEDCKDAVTLNGSRPIRCEAADLKIRVHDQFHVKETTIARAFFEIDEQFVTNVDGSSLNNSVKLLLNRVLDTGLAQTSSQSMSFGDDDSFSNCRFSK